MRALFIAIVTLLFAAGVFAQEDTYRLQPDDVIRIQIYNEAQVNADIPIGRDGNVSAPFVGTIRAEGKTTSELEAELAQEYTRKLRLREPRVSVTIIRFRPIRASVGGFVNRPGTFEMRPGDTLLTLLNQGGGPVPDRSDLRRATYRRANSRELIPIDLYAMLIMGDMSQNYAISDGDELTVPEEVLNRVLVMGAVMQPGAYPFKESMRVADAISLARGEVRYRSKLSEVMIVRRLKGQPDQNMYIRSNFVRFIRNQDSTQNVLLEPGDFVYVPETRTPDFNQIAALANTAFILDRFGGGFFGLRIFGR
jgi:protein involved in polysaccharide export with SLBB domain